MSTGCGHPEDGADVHRLCVGGGGVRRRAITAGRLQALSSRHEHRFSGGLRRRSGGRTAADAVRAAAAVELLENHRRAGVRACVCDRGVWEGGMSVVSLAVALAVLVIGGC